MMITNERQYGITKNKLQKLEESLLTTPPANLPEALQTAMTAGIRAKIQDLQLELETYEKLKKSTQLSISALDDLPEALIKVRIMRGITQKQLAEKLGVKEQQVQRDEAENYARAKIDKLIRIGKALGIEVQGTLSLR